VDAFLFQSLGVDQRDVAFTILGDDLLTPDLT